MDRKHIRKLPIFTIVLCALLAFAGCGSSVSAKTSTRTKVKTTKGRKANRLDIKKYYNKNTKISDVINDPVFSDYGRLIFPVEKGYYSGDTLGNLQLTWYSDIRPAKTVEIANYFKTQAKAGKKIFYNIYSDKEKKEDPDKKDTGIFFFRGKPGAKTAIVNAGGGFAYVGAMQDSFPVSLELAKKGYNVFALIYRPGAQTACEDLARTIAYLHEHADDLDIDMTDYSLWGGSAGARMAAWLGSYGTESFGEKKYPRPAAVIMQYTGLSEVYGNEPPTYNCVGTNDYIASYRTMEARINAIKKKGTDAEIEVFKGLSHGFGLGEGTVAEGWVNHAVSFWERNMKTPTNAKKGRNTTGDSVTVGTRRDRGFIVDNVLHSKSRGDIHFSSYVPDSYTGKEKYALFISLPGWEGEYPQGVGSNLQEFFPFEAQKYNKKMIIISPQLMGWDEASADDTIALTEYLLSAYNIDRSKVYLEGYSGGGETGSIAVGKRPDLYTAWLMGSSQWDGDYDSVVKAELPVYLAVGEGDSYYGSGPLKKAYNELYRRYVKKGLSESQISKLLVLDVKPASYFTSQGFTDQHAGGQAFANDKTIMSWLFEK